MQRLHTSFYGVKSVELLETNWIANIITDLVNMYIMLASPGQPIPYVLLLFNILLNSELSMFVDYNNTLINQK